MQTWYFTGMADDSGAYFAIVDQMFFNTHGYLSDDNISPELDAVLPQGFDEVSESTFFYEGDFDQGRQILLDLGFIENPAIIAQGGEE